MMATISDDLEMAWALGGTGHKNELKAFDEAPYTTNQSGAKAVFPLKCFCAKCVRSDALCVTHRLFMAICDKRAFFFCVGCFDESVYIRKCPWWMTPSETV